MSETNVIRSALQAIRQGDLTAIPALLDHLEETDDPRRGTADKIIGRFFYDCALLREEFGLPGGPDLPDYYSDQDATAWLKRSRRIWSRLSAGLEALLWREQGDCNVAAMTRLAMATLGLSKDDNGDLAND